MIVESPSSLTTAALRCGTGFGSKEDARLRSLAQYDHIAPRRPSEARAQYPDQGKSGREARRVRGALGSQDYRALQRYEVRLVKTSGERVRHKHDEMDELFPILKGEVDMEFRKVTVTVALESF